MTLPVGLGLSSSLEANTYQNFQLKVHVEYYFRSVSVYYTESVIH